MVSSIRPVFFLIFVLFEVNASANLRTKLLNVLLRHGDRTPKVTSTEAYPNDPYVNWTFYPEGAGGLTNAGKQRAYKAGQVIREHYGTFLTDIYSPSEVVALTTETERTMMTLQLALAGIYPPAKSQQWDYNLNWQPVVIGFPSAGNRNYLAIDCPEFFHEVDKIRNSPDGQLILSEFDELWQNLSTWTGKELEGYRGMSHVFNTLMAEWSMGLEVPDWSSGIFPHGKLYDAAVAEYEIANFNEKLLRINGGRVLKAIIERMSNVAEGRNQTKLNIMTSHESSIVALLSTLGVWTPHVPEYTSAVLVELLEDGSDHFVKVQYYKGIPPELEEKTIPGCDLLCPLDEFINLLAAVIPDDDEMNCS